jgi:hypothetical protein
MLRCAQVQIHGYLDMAHDVEALVLNVKHKGSASVTLLAERFMAKFGVNVIQLD